MDPDWNALVEELGPKLFRYFRARFTYEHSADLTQETLIRLVQKVRDGHFDSARGNFRMFAFGIAHFVALEAHKQTYEEPIPPFTHLDSKMEESLFEKQRTAQMRTALRELDQVQIQIISLMIDEEMTLIEIGVILGLPVGTVKSHVHRAKEHLRILLGVKETSL